MSETSIRCHGREAGTTAALNHALRDDQKDKGHVFYPPLGTHVQEGLGQRCDVSAPQWVSHQEMKSNCYCNTKTRNEVTELGLSTGRAHQPLSAY